MTEIASPLATHDAPKSRPSLIKRVWRGGRRFGGLAVGQAVLWAFLSLVAQIPGLSLLAVGYLLETSRRVATSGRLRDGCVGAPLGEAIAAWGVVLFVFLAPIRIVLSLRQSANWIDPTGTSRATWNVASVMVGCATAIVVVFVLRRSRRLHGFLFPIDFGLPRRPESIVGAWTWASDACWQIIVDRLRLPGLWWTGAWAVAASLVWVFLPAMFLAAGPPVRPLNIIGLLMFTLLGWYVPFLQTHWSLERRLGAMFEWRAIHRRFRAAPWAFAIAWSATIIAAVPLQILEFIDPPTAAEWLWMLPWFALHWPARLLVGWAYARSSKTGARVRWYLRWPAWIWIILLSFIYVLLLFLCRYQSAWGTASYFRPQTMLMLAPTAIR